MSPLGLVNMAYGCRPPRVNAGKKCAIVMASWDHGSRECLRLVCVSSSFFFSSSSIFFRISSLPLGAFGSFLPPFSFAAAAAAAFFISLNIAFLCFLCSSFFFPARMSLDT